MLLKRVRATLQHTPGPRGFGLTGKSWIALSCDKYSALPGKHGRKDYEGVASYVGSFTKDLERLEEFCREEKLCIIANTAKHLSQILGCNYPTAE